MLTKRLAQVGLFAVVAAVVALAQPGETRAHTWSIVTVEAGGDMGGWTSMAVAPNGDPMIAYSEWGGANNLKFAMCDISTGCDAPGDWTTKVTVDSSSIFWGHISLTVAPNGDPMISYYDETAGDLKFAWCDISDTPACNDWFDWYPMIVDSTDNVGQFNSITVAASGDPWISYYDVTSGDLKAALCQGWGGGATACDGDLKLWTFVMLDGTGVDVGKFTSNGEAAGYRPTISYYDETNDNLKFAICLEPLDPGCSLPIHWDFVTVDSGYQGKYTSIAADASGNPMISYQGDNYDLKFAWCDMSTLCDAAGDWTTKVAVDTSGTVGYWTSIAANANGDPMISHYDITLDAVKFAWCDISATGCDASSDWGIEVVDSSVVSGLYTSIAVLDSGDPIISYQGSLDVATGVACETTLNGDFYVDDTEIWVDSLAGCEVDNYILIGDDPDSGPQDCRQIAWTESGDVNSIYFYEGLDNNQGTGEAVVEVPSCGPTEPPEPPYPPAPAEPDVMTVTLTFDYLDLDENDDGIPEYRVPGPISFIGRGLFDRGEPYQDAGAANRWTIDTEIVSMELDGEILGYDVIIVSGWDIDPELASPGQIQEQTPESGGFPADSFFDVTFEIHSADPDYDVMRNCDSDGPAHFEGVTNAVPASNVEYNADVAEIDACEWRLPLAPGDALGGSPQAWRWTSVSGGGGWGAGILYVGGGIAEWPEAAVGADSSAGPPSESGFNYAALGGALAAVAAIVALATGAWFARRRWLT